MRLDDLLNDYLDENLGIKKTTEVSYRVTVNVFRRFLGVEPEAKHLDQKTVSQFLRWMLSLPRSIETVENKRRMLMMLAKYARRKRLIEKLPRIRKLSIPRRNPRAFMHTQVCRLIEGCRRARPLADGTWTAAEWEILARLVCEAGRRTTCLFTLRFCDISDDWVCVRGENEKTGIEAPMQLSPDLLALIESRRVARSAESGERILPWPFCRRYMWFCFRRDVLKPAGLDGERLSFYGVLRWATSEIAAATDESTAMKFRGHTNPETTKRYLDVRITGQGIAHKPYQILPRIA